MDPTFTKFYCCFSVISCVRLFATPWTQHTGLYCPSLISQSLLKFMSIESVMLPNHLILCCFLLFLPSIFLNIKVFSNGSDLRIKWPEYWSFSFSISPSSEFSGLIFFRIDWFDFLAVQGTLKSLLQQHNLKASVLWCSALWSKSHIHTWLLEKPEFWLDRRLLAK